LHLGAHGPGLRRALSPPARGTSAAAGCRMRSARFPQEAIQIEDRWYVLATSSQAGEPARVLKHGETFALCDRYGDLPRAGSGEHGLYHQGTRFLSFHELRLNDQRPIVLNSSVRRDNGVLTVD